MATIKDWDGKYFSPVMVNGCANIMFNCMSCGTVTMCPTSIGGRMVLTNGGENAQIIDNTFCFCLKPSPCPCLMGCGVGPCAQVPKFKKESETVYVGTGESQCAGGCCQMMMHNAGDKISILENGDFIWSTGNSPFYPPCLQGKDIAKAVAKGGAPVQAEMAR